MSQLSPAFLDELRARLPLSDIVGRRVRLVRAGREYKGCCPFHNEKTPSFYVNDEKQFFHCFGCGAHGDVVRFVMRLDHLSFPEAIESLASQAGLEVPKDTAQSREKYDREKRLYQILERATAFFEEQLRTPQGREAVAYLQKRGLTDEIARRFQLGYAPQDGQALIRKMMGEGFSAEDLIAVGLAKKSAERNELFSFFRNRVMFPVGDRRGQTVAFGGRVMGEGEPKYLNSPDHPLFHKGKLLYGLSRARTALAQGQPVVVVEGYMDVITMVEAGYQGAVAPLGTALTEDQLGALWKLAPSLENRTAGRDYSPILCFDGDNAGQKAALRGVERALPLLTIANTIRIAFLPTGEDPDSLLRREGKIAMQNVLDRAKPMIELLWDSTREGRKLQTPEERGLFIATLKQKTARINDPSLRALYSDALQKRLASAFQWQGNEQNSWFAPAQTASDSPASFGREASQSSRKWAGKGGKNLSKGTYTQTQPIPPRPVPVEAGALRERVFLALMVNFPELFADFGEDFGLMSFQDRTRDALRQEITQLLSTDSHETLDAQALYRHLCRGENAGFSTGKAGAEDWSSILSESTYRYAGFARPRKSGGDAERLAIESAKQGWKSIWNKHLQESLHADLERASRAYAAEDSDENWARLVALRTQIEKTAAELAELESQENESIFS